MIKHLSLNGDLSWRDILLRIALIVATMGLIVWAMPREKVFNFKIERGQPWRYSDLTAPFDFPVYKSEETVKAERDSILQFYEPYYTLNKEVEAQLMRQFMQDFSGGLPGLSGDYKSIIANRLHRFYAQGIIASNDTAINLADTTQTILLVSGKTAVSVKTSDLLTTVEAYEQLFSDPMLKQHSEALRGLNLNNYIRPNLIYDEERSETSRQELLATVALANGYVLRGQKIIDRGAIVDDYSALAIASFLREVAHRSETTSRLSSSILGETLYVLILLACFAVFLAVSRPAIFENVQSMMMLLALIALFSISASLLVGHSLLHVFIIPFAMVPIFVSVFIDSRTAFVAHSVVILIVASLLQKPLEFIAVEMVAGMVAIFSLRELSSRSQLLWTAALSTAAAMLTNLSLELIHAGNVTQLSFSDYNFLAVCGVFLFCSYPLLYIIEKTFGFISAITLIELSDMNKELLRRMSEVAPGTFNHSIQVANLAAEIARKIGADAQLVRTAALYHDIGKIQNPIYFTENQSGDINPHEQLSCVDSAQIIISHVTEGLKLAQSHNLPESLQAFIATHHGQGKAKYFYVKYKNEHPDEAVDELLFTYPGPNPYTREQAILMMADAVEAASRSLPDYTEQSIRTLVGRILDSQLQEGYFRECPITFRDIQYAKTVLIEKLKTIYHTRISYPELKK